MDWWWGGGVVVLLLPGVGDFDGAVGFEGLWGVDVRGVRATDGVVGVAVVFPAADAAVAAGEG